ncbi:YbaN family protein [Rhizobium sp. CFBP 8762]|uniref:YbaN family protein n=1 Tax=Rhizobium sp. CFBP 8762 TaxID=2775279 RepID=UPI00177DD02E|nr:YbaN family protein [Rhizobium sp. CFBP 8762]MBD8556681.1 YbaN family protein [Rhizobium sp. CFBP 8762]
MRLFYLAAGWAMVVLGVVGIFLPLLPTTPFLLAAAWFFSRGSPVLERWLLNHKTLGPPLQDWRARGAISRRAKMTAIAMIIASYCLLLFYVQPSTIVLVVVGITLMGSSTFILTRPGR